MKLILSSKRHYYLARVITLLITVALIAGMGGCGPLPTKIHDWYDLDAVRDNLAGSYILMNDLDSTTAGYDELAGRTANEGKGWEPIGILGGTAPFTGIFDGQGYEIRDLFINRPNQKRIGLFGMIDYGAVVENLGVVNFTIVGDGAVGGLVGLNDGPISNSYSTGNVTGREHVGGLVGVNSGTVSDSYSTSSVTGDEGVGGLVGWNYQGTVSNSYSASNVTGTNSVGGLLGKNTAIVSNSFWDTETSGQSTSDGGTGKTTVEMQDIATFSGAAWDIIAVTLNETNPAYTWNIVNNVTYPFLSWEP